VPRQRRTARLQPASRAHRLCDGVGSAGRPRATRWNALLAAFAVYFRNTRIFLTGDGDQESIKAKNYIKRFSPSSAKELEAELNDLHSHVLHLSGKRTSKNEEKLGLAEVLKLMKWLEPNIRQFVNELEQPYKQLWQGAGPKEPTTAEKKENRGWTGPAGPSATNQITSTTNKYKAE
jgi:hypothetical protein